MIIRPTLAALAVAAAFPSVTQAAEHEQPTVVVTAPLPDGVGLTLIEAAQVLSTTPARILGLATQGQIAPGYAADLVAIDATGQVRLTLIGGQIAYDGRG